MGLGKCARCQFHDAARAHDRLCDLCVHLMSRNPLLARPLEEVTLDLISIYLERGERGIALRLLLSYGYDRITQEA